MAEHNNGKNSASQQLEAKPVFHDFLGMKPTDSLVVLAPKTTDARLSEASPSSASVSVAASSGGPRGPFSTTSDIGSGEWVPHLSTHTTFVLPKSACLKFSVITVKRKEIRLYHILSLQHLMGGIMNFRWKPWLLLVCFVFWFSSTDVLKPSVSFISYPFLVGYLWEGLVLLRPELG